MPLAAPLALMSWKIRLLDPIVVLATLSAVPVVVLMLLLALLALTVPPLVALKPVWVVESMLRAPVKLIVAPLLASLLSRLMPRPGSVIAPLNAIVLPPAAVEPAFVTFTEWPAATLVIEEAIDTSAETLLI